MSSQGKPESDVPPTFTVDRPSGRAYAESRGFGTWSVVAAVLVGAAVGAAAALLTAPESGRDTRGAIAGRARRLVGRDDSAWRRLRKSFAQARRERARLKMREAEAKSDETGAAAGKDRAEGR